MLEFDDPLATGRAIPATLASQTYERLRQDIVGAHFAPGQKLGTRQLSERYEVGLAPLREALTRLSREGLVVQHDRRGFAVPNLAAPTWKNCRARAAGSTTSPCEHPSSTPTRPGCKAWCRPTTA